MVAGVLGDGGEYVSSLLRKEVLVMKNKEAEKILQEDLGVEILSAFPENINIRYDNSEHILTMILLAKFAGLSSAKDINMQNDAAAFEAWALIIKAQTSIDDLKIKLDVKGFTSDMYDKDIPSTVHFGRFLYRILKFSEQYKAWFTLSPCLEDVKNKFAEFLADGEFVNNVPSGEACNVETSLSLEGHVEKRFCDTDSNGKLILGFDGRNVVMNRQLPVGLFKKRSLKDKKGKAVFTGKKSAIDFWVLDGNIFNIYELKAKNSMVGILTEIFFYSNYVRDVYWHKKLQKESCNVKLESPKTTDRDYDKLYSISDDISKITGWLLADKFHPAITEKVLELMNKNTIQEELQYKMKRYKINMDFSSVNGE
jgi:hypothetical protein